MSPERAAPRTRAPRQSSKAVRRQELIEATIDSLAKRGYEATTLADVAHGAGLSRGIVNFHFETKEKLLVETLRLLSDEYRGHWRGALKAAGEDPAARLWALVSADFDRKVCTPRKLAAWCAFWGEAKSRSSYRELCSANDDEYQSTVSELCARLAAPGQDAAALARALACLLEGLWLNLMMAPKDLRRDQALACARTHLAVVFPHHFTVGGPIAAPAAAGASNTASDDPAAPKKASAPKSASAPKNASVPKNASAPKNASSPEKASASKKESAQKDTAPAKGTAPPTTSRSRRGRSAREGAL